MITLHDFGGDLGRPLDTFNWALTISWSRLLARVWGGPWGWSGLTCTDVQKQELGEDERARSACWPLCRQIRMNGILFHRRFQMNVVRSMKPRAALPRVLPAETSKLADDRSLFLSSPLADTCGHRRCPWRTAEEPWMNRWPVHRSLAPCPMWMNLCSRGWMNTVLVHHSIFWNEHLTGFLYTLVCAINLPHTNFECLFPQQQNNY